MPKMRMLLPFLTLALVMSASPPACANEIWFAPRWQKMQPFDGGRQGIDYSALFKPGAPWDTTAAHVAVFKINPHMIKTASDRALTLIFRNLRERHIQLAMEYGVLDQPATPGFRVEGFHPEPETAQATIARIKAHGGTLDYLAMDEPYWYASIYDGKYAVHWPTARIAANAAKTMVLFQRAFPGIRMGDIEPVINTPGLTRRYAGWLDALQRAMGEPPAFFHLDIVWNKPWRNSFETVTSMLAAKHVPLGIIYNQSSEDLSNDHWLAAAQEHYEDMENNGGLVPDEAIFQSWSAMPNRLLPEDAPNTHTHLVLTYLRERMNLTAAQKGAYVTGRLTDVEDRPVTEGAVRLESATDSAHWKTVQTGSTDADGRVQFRRPTPTMRAVRYRLEFSGDARHRAVRTEFKM
jgi:hypothetical protein